MKKIKLNLNQLKVDSFETSQPNTKEGTVQGNLPLSADKICSGYFSCISCIESCGLTCGADTCTPTCLNTCGNTCLVC